QQYLRARNLDDLADGDRLPDRGNGRRLSYGTSFVRRRAEYAIYGSTGFASGGAQMLPKPAPNQTEIAWHAICTPAYQRMPRAARSRYRPAVMISAGLYAAAPSVRRKPETATRAGGAA